MENVYFEVPFKDKDLARSIGARWDKSLQRWYAPNESVREQMENYHWATSLPPAKKQKITKISSFFDIPYKDATLAESKGASWNNEKKRYCAETDAVHEKLAMYWDQLPEPITPSPFIELEGETQREIPETEIWTSDFFDVPYPKRNVCKTYLHASWDSSVKKWKASNRYMWENMRLYFSPFEFREEQSLPSDD